MAPQHGMARRAPAGLPISVMLALAFKVSLRLAASSFLPDVVAGVANTGDQIGLARHVGWTTFIFCRCTNPGGVAVRVVVHRLGRRAILSAIAGIPDSAGTSTWYLAWKHQYFALILSGLLRDVHSTRSGSQICRRR